MNVGFLEIDRGFENELQQIIYGSMLGTALGDSVGLYYEGLSRQKIAKKNPNFGQIDLIFGKGLFSDDTEHTIIVAQCLIESFYDEELFRKLLAKRMQLWFLALPAGIGFATMRGILKSFFLKKSGVFSAGNGPAMRSSLIGIMFGNDNERLKEFIKINTYLTHTDPKAYYGALTVAKATYLTAIDNRGRFFGTMKKLVKDEEFHKLLTEIEDSLELTTMEFAQRLGLEKGVSGYIYHTLPIAIHSWLRNGNDIKQAIIDVIKCGGDTDTTGAIVGGIMGAGTKSFPKEWSENIIDYPRNLKFLETLSIKLEEVIKNQKSQKAPKLSAIAIIIRNFLFIFLIFILAITRLF